MLIEFDPAKDARNQQKHGVSLALAETFDWATVLSSPARTEHGEARLSVIGDIDGAVYVAIVTPRGERQRIISLRLANRKERRLYVTTIRHS